MFVDSGSWSALTVAITGAGTVTSNPAGIDCGTDCSENYSSGTVVMLTATADAGFTFIGWSSACTTTASGDCQVTMNAAKSVTATFNKLPSFTLKITKTGSGRGTVQSGEGKINCGTTCSANYPSGTRVTLTATPDAESTFTGWSGACTGKDPCQVTMNAVKSVIATFNKLPSFTLKVTKTGSGRGTVRSGEGKINCGTTCSANYPSGTRVTLTATPDAESTFTGWSSACTTTASGDCQVTLNAAKSVTATFKSFTLKVTKAGGGLGTVQSGDRKIECGTTCSAKYLSGTSVTLTATPTTGSSFTGWSGASCTGKGVCKVTMTQARTVTASFRKS